MRLLNTIGVWSFAWNRENKTCENVENLMYFRCKLRHIGVFETSL